MASSSPPLDEQGRPVHGNNIRPHRPRPRELYESSVAKGIQTAFLGPMSPTKIISESFPRNASKEVSSAFKPGLFEELAAPCAPRGGKMEEMVFDLFVRT
jgi:hypothetical protein